MQRGRTTEEVLRLAGEGIARLRMRFVVFQIDGDDLVLRYTTRVGAETIPSIMTEETDRLNAIVTDLLEYARPSAFRTEEATLGALVRDAADALMQLPEAVRGDLQLDLARDLPLVQTESQLSLTRGAAAARPLRAAGTG